MYIHLTTKKNAGPYDPKSNIHVIKQKSKAHIRKRTGENTVYLFICENRKQNESLRTDKTRCLRGGWGGSEAEGGGVGRRFSEAAV